MDENKNESIGNIGAVIGGALLGMAIVDQVTKAIAPTMQKLTSGEPMEQLKLLPREQEKQPEKQLQEQKERDSSQNEIAELKRKLAEFEEKSTGQRQ